MLRGDFVLLHFHGLRSPLEGKLGPEDPHRCEDGRAIRHCSCRKHSVDAPHVDGRNWDKEVVRFELHEKCPDGGWHLESGVPR